MFLIGICIHLCFLFSIFDIYFKSPIVKNVQVYVPQHEAVADRLVLLMVDGLRAESFVNYTTMPYLRSIANSNGRWGISHTRVPTESRPGHVAVIAGFYEDPSAVAKGWKQNPVDFDSVFNRTTYTWCLGAYDIVEVFTKGNVEDHIFSNKFNPYHKTFSTDKNETKLDAWVFNSTKALFVNATKDKNLNEKLRKRKIAFFLHLLGTDTSGHVRKPKTEHFLTTIRHVDEGVKDIEKTIRDFYGDDGKTTFLMTSDHGMTDWGTHGAGDDHETQTPYVIWGAGVQQVANSQIDPQTNKMSKAHRMDLNQADLTPLMSTILSIPVPVNSIGQLRSELLNLSLADKAKAIYSNSRQLAHQYDKKRSDIEADAIKLLHQPFRPFTKDKYDKMIAFTENLLAKEKYEELILLSQEIMDLSLRGLSYYHNYYQRPLLFLVSLSFIGWIVCLLKLLVEQMMNTQDEHSILNKFSFSNNFNTLLNVAFLVLFLLSTVLVFAQNLPAQYYIYFTMPVYLWWYALSGTNVWIKVLRHFKQKRQVYLMCMTALCYFMGSVALAFCFTYRWMLSIPLCGMGLWPFISSHRKWPIPLLLSWVLSCASLSLFSFMSIIGKKVFIELVILAGFIWLLLIATYLWKLLLPFYRDHEEKRKDVVLTVVQMILLTLSLHNIYTQSRRFSLGTAVSCVDQTIAWIIAVLSFLLPFLSSRRAIIRLMATYTSLLNFYLLLSVSHEGLFMVTLIFSVTCWILMEFELLNLKHVKISECILDRDFLGKSSKDPISIERSLCKEDFRRAFFYITFIITAFFGTGNIASLNSFEIRWVTCFITSFRPFIITGLILLKTLAPFLIVGCSFRAVQFVTKAPIGYMNVIVLIYSNIMGILLLYYVRNTGSWLEIGTSISQYVIVQLITLFVVLINQVTKILLEQNRYLNIIQFLVKRAKSSLISKTPKTSSNMSKSKDVGCAFIQIESIKGEKLIYPAANRNKEPILQVLKRFLLCDLDEIEDESPLFLEVASGSGQHLAHFAPAFPGVKFQPTEVDENLLGSISYYAQNCPTKNILPPKLVDICTKLSHYGFQEGSIDYLYNANMIHISPYECTIGLFENAGAYLKPDALMITYGPFAKDGVLTPASNVEFDASLKARNPTWGIRDINDLVKLGAENNLTLVDTIEMPANNKTLIWKKD